jgi:alpha-glucosidase
LGTRIGEEMIDAWNMFTLTLRGATITYYGEEIGMTNNFDISYEETVDPSGCNCGPDRYNSVQDCSRDPERTPMQWTDGANAGFTDAGATPWLPVNANYQTINVRTQESDPFSHLNLYKAVANTRRQGIFDRGVSNIFREGDIIAVVRHLVEGNDSAYVTLVNFGSTRGTINLRAELDRIGAIVSVYNYGIVEVNTQEPAG